MLKITKGSRPVRAFDVLIEFGLQQIFPNDLAFSAAEALRDA
jgi:hypothetical protein